MLGDGQALVGVLDSFVVVEIVVVMDCLFELVDIAPTAVVIHLVFHASEESLTGSVVGTVALAAHRQCNTGVGC